MGNNNNMEVSTDISILNEHSYGRLKGMFNSEDEADHKIGQILLSKVNVEKSIYYIWLLAQNCRPGNLVNLRTKAGRELNEACQGVVRFQWTSEPEFGRFLISKGWMTPEIFMKLKEPLRNDVHNKIAREPFYEFSIELKQENKHLDPDDKLTKI